MQHDSKDYSGLRLKFRYIRNNWQLYVIFMLPAFALTVLFKYVPMGGILMAFQNYSGRLGILGSKFIGLENFRRFFSSAEFWRLMGNTLKLSVFSLMWGFWPPILLALLLSRIKNAGLKQKMQLVLYAPNFISTIVVAGMLFVLLSPIGPLNRVMGTTINFMTNPGAFRTIYISSGIWQGAGWASIIYTAALSSVDTELIDACAIDGASLWQQIKNVDIPALQPIMVVQFILAAGQIMNIGFEKALALQIPMNRIASEIIPTYVYRQGLEVGDYGYSTAVGLFNAVINVILLLAVNHVVKTLNEGQGL